jgi:hypothetical protein
MRKPLPPSKKRLMWALRLEPELLRVVKRKGRKAAPWVRALMWEAVNK